MIREITLFIRKFKGQEFHLESLVRQLWINRNLSHVDFKHDIAIVSNTISEVKQNKSRT